MVQENLENKLHDGSKKDKEKYPWGSYNWVEEHAYIFPPVIFLSSIVSTTAGIPVAGFILTVAWAIPLAGYLFWRESTRYAKLEYNPGTNDKRIKNSGRIPHVQCSKCNRIYISLVFSSCPHCNPKDKKY